MDRKELEAKIIECVSITYAVPAEDLSMDTLVKEDLKSQSIQMVGLVSLIENELDVLVQLPDAASSKTLGELCDKVEALI